MTLIVCLKAADCIVLAADSLSTRGGNVLSCDTRKLMPLGTGATGGAGLSRVQGRVWSEIISDYASSGVTDADFGRLAGSFEKFLNAEIAKIPASNVGANQGGNTFLLAGYDQATSGLLVARLVRCGIKREFDPFVIASQATDHHYIEWLGDKGRLAAHISAVEAAYDPDMDQTSAVTFAMEVISQGIKLDRAAGGHTIGGDFIRRVVVTKTEVNFSEETSGISCVVSAP